MKELIFGKETMSNIVGMEIEDNEMVVYTEKAGKVDHTFLPHKFWTLSCNPNTTDHKRLVGDNFYKYIKYEDTRKAWALSRKQGYKRQDYSTHDVREAAMIHDGLTYFKGMKIGDVSVLAFDLETTGIAKNDGSKVLLIANTFRRGDTTVKRLFCYDDYDSPKAMFDAWCAWVCEMNPSIMLGHNIMGYDLPYLKFCADRAGATLALGRDGSALEIEEYVSKFRKDGSQKYDFQNVRVFGRELIDTFFLSMKYDIGRKYMSYGLKAIIEHEGLQKKNRQFYDAATIKDNYKKPEEWRKIKAYAEDDGDDALALFDLMAPAEFYLTQSVPRSFQQIVNTATGSQLNSFMLRAYLQDGKSIPKASENVPFQGAISFGIPGVYKNTCRFDAASLYPSIMLTYKVYDKYKDPDALMLKSLQYFTDQRLSNKKLAKETGDPYYQALDQSGKRFINSAYGFMGAVGLNFNSPTNAAFVTTKGREIVSKAVEWASSNSVEYWIGKINE